MQSNLSKIVAPIIQSDTFPIYKLVAAQISSMTLEIGVLSITAVVEPLEKVRLAFFQSIK